jgi:hypothetical protein
MICFTCPCGKPVNAGDQYAGQTTHCLYCNRELTIPGVAAVQGADAPRTTSPLSSEGVQSSRRADRPSENERAPQPATSGMAIASVVLGVLSLCVGSFLTGVPAVILGILGQRTIGRSEGRLKGKGMAKTGLVLGLFGSLVPILLLLAVQSVRETANRLWSANNLKQSSLAMHSYADANGTWTPAAICDAQGKPLLSWRVAILPYIEQGRLYQQFKLDEPWDGPHNSKLLALMPKEYGLRGDTTTPPDHTYYRVFVGNGAAFDPPRPSGQFGITPGTPPNDFTDGKTNTILIVEAATAVPWTKPEDFDYDPDGPLPPLGGHFSGGAQVVMADGSVRMIPKNVSQKTLRAAITRNAGDELGPDW